MTFLFELVLGAILSFILFGFGYVIGYFKGKGEPRP
jgi:hypothetical protein